MRAATPARCWRPCGHGGGNSAGGRQEVPLADRVGASWRGRSVGQMAGQWQTGCRQVGSGRARNRARASLNWFSQGQRWGRCKVRRRAELVSRPAIEKKRRRRVLVVTTGSPRPMRAVQRARLWAITWTASQAALAAKRPEGRWLKPDAVLEVSDGVLDLGVAPMVGLQFQGCPVPVGDEAVIAVVDEQRQLGAGRGFYPPDDEPHRCGVRLTLEGGVGGLGHSGGAVHPVRNRRPVRLGYRLNEIPQALVLADGDGEADIHCAADRDQGVGIEAAVGPHRELPPGPAVAHPSHRLTQEVGGAPSRVGPALASRDISTSPVPAAMASSG